MSDGLSAGARTDGETRALEAIGTALRLDTGALQLDGATSTWRGPFDVNALAAASVGAATLAAAELHMARTGQRSAAASVSVQREHAALAFLTEGLSRPQGWQLPATWDPIAGDYPTRDGWIRLHTNYVHHRRAALAVLELPDTDATSADVVRARVATYASEALESAVVAAGGVAGQQRSMADWATHPQGRAVANEALLDMQAATVTAAEPAWAGASAMPFAGVRVLDLTRVLAGPVATGWLAAWGADVLRIDPLGFAEVAALVPITTAGKRTLRLDLASAAGQAVLGDLLRTADVVVHGYRGNALANLGLDPERWLTQFPGLVGASLDAYGWSGPWAARRGFDSIVQHSIGITLAGQQALGRDTPTPLPCQALDYATGWLLAAAVATGLRRRLQSGHGSQWRASLARTGKLLLDLGDHQDPHQPPPPGTLIKRFSGVADTAWGPLQRVTWPGRIDHAQPELKPSVALGSHTAVWLPRA